VNSIYLVIELVCGLVMRILLLMRERLTVIVLGDGDVRRNMGNLEYILDSQMLSRLFMFSIFT
jgi:hypothetical protein